MSATPRKTTKPRKPRKATEPSKLSKLREATARATPNRQGLATRIRIQQSLLTLLRTTPWSKIDIPSIAKMSLISPAAVYVYHANLDAIALATVERLEKEGEKVPEHLAAVVNLLRFESDNGLV